MTTPSSNPPPARPIPAIEADIAAEEARLQQLRDELTTAQWLAQYDAARPSRVAAHA